MKITLRNKKLRNARLRLYIEYYDKKRLSPEILDLWIYENPKTFDEKEHNKNHTAKAEDILETRQRDYDKGRLINSKDTLMDYFKEYYNGLTKGKNLCKHSVDHLEAFLKKRGIENILLTKLNPVLFEDFASYLKEETINKNKKGDVKIKESTARYYMVYLKLMLKRAAKEKRINFYPSEIDVKYEKVRKKNKRYVPAEELRLIYNYHRFEVVKKAFLFCVNTGLGAGELTNLNPEKSLKWKHIKNGLIKDFERSKTGISVIIGLNDDAVSLMGERGRPDDAVFNLPAASVINYQMRKMSQDLNIPHTTFYCGRHTFITNSMNSARNAGVVSDMTGSAIRSLQHYNHEREDLIKEAVKGLPSVLGK